jgi:hypothetical protein
MGKANYALKIQAVSMWESGKSESRITWTLSDIPAPKHLKPSRHREKESVGARKGPSRDRRYIEPDI